MLAGCVAQTSTPPTVAATPKPVPQTVSTVTATGKDTVAAIAQRYHLSPDDIIRVNKLNPPYKLKAGQQLKLPPPRNYKVKAGDTLASVAKLFGVTAADIARINGVPVSYKLKPGQQLRVPPNAKAPSPSLATSVESGFNTAGKSLTSVIRHFALYDDGDSADPVAPSETPGVAATTSVKDDEELDRTPTQTSATPATASSDAVTTAAMPNRSGIQTEALGAPASPAVTAVTAHADAASLAPEPVKPTPDEPKAPVSSAHAILSNQPAGRFDWPLRGTIISGYGPKSGGLHNDGLNIRAARGTAVKAAGPGTVVYAGSGVKGYGNLVLIRHADRWMTAYAHLDSIDVEKGQEIAQGAKIGTVGETGGVSGPQLHFEIRHGTEPLNPVAFMPKR